MDTTSGPLSYILGKNLVSQILLTIVVMLAAYSVITIFETVVTMVRRFN